jgi:hypothetical protein
MLRGRRRYSRWMAGKAFNPFEADEETADGSEDLEFIPGAAKAIGSDEPTRIKPKPLEADPDSTMSWPSGPNPSQAPMKLDFDELDENADLRNATAIGAEELGADQFLTGIKKKDYEEATARAKQAQAGRARVRIEAAPEVEKVKAPVHYAVWAGFVLFLLGLCGGGWYLKAQHDAQQAQDVQKILDATRGVNAAPKDAPEPEPAPK